jgi:signal transduction histidine kinase
MTTANKVLAGARAMSNFKFFTLTVGLVAGAVIVAATPNLASAQSTATRQDAIDLVKQAIAALNSAGADATYAEISNPSGKYAKGDLYLVAYDMSGKVLAHGFNRSLVGRDMSKARDPDGKNYIAERLEMAKTQKTFWQSYKYIEPTTHQLRLKDSYCERTGDVIICGGVYH